LYGVGKAKMCEGETPDILDHVNSEVVMQKDNNNALRGYWKENLSIMTVLLTIWFVVSYGFGILLVDVLNNFQFFGFKLGFWFAQQGAIYVFVGLIFYYVARMNRLDQKYDVHED
jgi:putative solute:sodium symporter small subunit